MNDSLEKFGAFLVRNLRDKMLDDLEMFLQGKMEGSAGHTGAAKKS